MRSSACLIALIIAAVLFQTAIIPAVLPPVLRPDIGILIGVAILAFGERDFALISIFCLGLQADIFGSARFGLLTLCYLLAAGLILLVAWRELTRGDLVAAWFGGIAGTFVAHFLYVFIGRFCGLDLSWGQAFTTLRSLTISASIWGLPCAFVCGRFMARMNMLSSPVREKWAAASRHRQARRGKV